MSSQANKDQFLKQFEHIVDGIKASKAKVSYRDAWPSFPAKIIRSPNIIFVITYAFTWKWFQLQIIFN